jgi:mannosyl-oligosaccharide alpha-1,2-mannosidase
MRISFLSLILPAWHLMGRVVAHPAPFYKPVAQEESEASQRANAVKDAFQVAWSGYKQHAFPHDQLHPLSNSYDDDLYGSPAEPHFDARTTW